VKRPPFTLRHPRAALAVAFVVIAVLGIAGLGVQDKLRPSSVAIPGTESARGLDLQDRHFGDSAPFAILLRGPAAALDRQGPALIAELRTDPRVTTISPWDRGSVDRLRPEPGKALILADFHVSAEDAVRDTVPYLDRTLEEEIRAPVRATQTGFATLSRAIQDESVHSTKVAELIAVPILLLVLLFVFRSPVAAAIPLLFGALTVTASRGVVALAAPHMTVDGFALTVCSMMGLALGVDYALLIVSRFREELARGAPPAAAAATTRRTAGRTAAFAGSTLVLAMAVTLLVMPGSLFLSLAGAAIVVTVISVLIADLVAPPLLLLLGPHVDRWRLAGDGDGKRLMGTVGAALARPRLAAALIGGALLLLAAPALGTETGPPSATQLPESNDAREDAELVGREIGPGWDAPFVLLAATEFGPVTGPARLDELSRAQRRIARDGGVQAVIGPAQLARRVAPLREGGNELLAGRGEASPQRLRKLGRGLDRAAGGVGQLRRGLSDAASGAGLLATGSGRAGEGAERIAGGLERAASGAERASGALAQLEQGSGRLAEGQRRAALGAESLQFELTELLPAIRGNGLARARKLRSSLRQAAAADPAFADDAREAERLVEVLSIARNEVQRLGNLAGNVQDGQQKLAEGGAELHDGADRLATASEPLASGLERLGAGATELATGLERLTGGADTLSSKLAEGYQRSEPLQGGLARSGVRVSGSADRLDRQVSQLRRSSPHIFDSGYFVLSALAGAPPEQRGRAGRVVDLAHGGQAAQILVIPRSTFDTPASAALNERLRGQAEALSEASGLRTAVTGGPAQLIDYEQTITDRIPLVIAAISLVTFLMLVVVLRAIPLAALAVGLNLLTVAVAFGVLTLLFEVPEGWPLGGHTYVDAIGAAGIFGIVFGLSIDYAVFLLMRMREAREAGAANPAAISFGLERTARVITGAAAIMAAVFACFALAPIATVSQLGVGLTVAVILDATVVRIVLLPALMLLAGERIWWLPAPLARILPKVELHTT
jgi:RND superfamily putative drug exporter